MNLTNLSTKDIAVLLSSPQVSENLLTALQIDERKTVKRLLSHYKNEQAEKKRLIKHPSIEQYIPTLG